MDTLGRIKLLPEILEDKIFLFIPRRQHITELFLLNNLKKKSHFTNSDRFRDQVEYYLDQHVNNNSQYSLSRPSLIRLLEDTQY